MDEFKKDLIEAIKKNIDTDNLKEKYGDGSVDFIAQGMIDSIQGSLRIINMAKRMKD